MNEVVIAGSGPTGLMLAGELALAGVDVAIVERRPTPELVGSRAGGFHSRTLEILDQRGIADRFLAEGQVVQAAGFGSTMLDLSDFPTRHPYSLGLFQNHIERILLGWVEELAVPIHRGIAVTGFVQDDTGVDLQLAEGEPMRTQYLVGADGGRSVIRQAAGIDFVGEDATRSNLIAEVEVTEKTPEGVRQDATGIHGLHPMADGRTMRVVVTEQQLGPATEPTLADLSEALTVVFGTDFGVHHPTWISRFTDATRQAAAYRDRRVLLAGDAAHTHSPAGGQGIGLGVQDAVNLGWKLAQVVRGISPDALLDSYHSERHPAGARALRHTMAQSLLQRGDVRIGALRDTVADLLGFDGPRTLVAGLVSGLDVAYDLGEGHPLLGRRMPDLDLVTPDGPLRVYALLHGARPVLLDLGEPASIDITPWADRVRHVDRRLQRDVGPPRARGRHRPDRRAGAARRPRGVGGRRNADGTRGGPHHVVRAARDGPAGGGRRGVASLVDAGLHRRLMAGRPGERLDPHPHLVGELCPPPDGLAMDRHVAHRVGAVRRRRHGERGPYGVLRRSALHRPERPDVGPVRCRHPPELEAVDVEPQGVGQGELGAERGGVVDDLGDLRVAVAAWVPQAPARHQLLPVRHEATAHLAQDGGVGDELHGRQEGVALLLEVHDPGAPPEAFHRFLRR